MKEPKRNWGVGGAELLAAGDEVWEDRGPRPGAHSGSLECLCVWLSARPWGPVVWKPTRVTIIE